MKSIWKFNPLRDVNVYTTTKHCFVQYFGAILSWSITSHRRHLTPAVADDFWKHCNKRWNCSKRAISYYIGIISALYQYNCFSFLDWWHFSSDDCKADDLARPGENVPCCISEEWRIRLTWYKDVVSWIHINLYPAVCDINNR